VAETVYLLCAVTSVACAMLLLRQWSRARTRLLFWSGLCFVALAVNNILLFIDLAILPTTIDLSLWRNSIACGAMGLLLYGLIRESP